MVLEYVQSLLFSFPVVGTQYDKSFAGSSGYFKGFVPTNYLFYKAFQVVSKFIYANGVHKKPPNGTETPYNYKVTTPTNTSTGKKFPARQFCPCGWRYFRPDPLCANN